jgi:hypothetical protein
MSIVDKIKSWFGGGKDTAAQDETGQDAAASNEPQGGTTGTATDTQVAQSADAANPADAEPQSTPDAS